MRRIKALFWKEYIQIFKDPSSFLIAFVMPILFLIVYGAGISLDIKNLKLGVVIEDNNSTSRSLADSFQFSKYFKTTFAQNRQEIYPLLTAGKLDGIVVIPFYFGREKLKDRIQLITDGSDPNTATFIKNYVEGTVGNWKRITQQQITPSGIKANTRVWFNEELNSQNFIIPGSLVIILTLTGSLLTSLVIAREWEKGTMEALMATPVSMKEIILSKFLSYFVMGIGTLFILYIFVRFGFGVPFRGSFGALLYVSCAYLSFVLGVGILISALTKNQFASTQASIFISFLPAYILSGFLFEIDSMPIALRWTSNILPPKFYVQSLQTLFLVGNVNSIIIPNGLILFSYALIIFVFIIKKSKKRLD